jgi:hypothetical protein
MTGFLPDGPLAVSVYMPELEGVNLNQAARVLEHLASVKVLSKEKEPLQSPASMTVALAQEFPWALSNCWEVETNHANSMKRINLHSRV